MNAKAQSQVYPSSSLSFASAPATIIQRKCACGGSAGLTGECDECQKEKLVGDNAPLIQTKLKISQPNDKYEQEADRVADEVMRMPEPRLQRQVEPEEDEEEEKIIQVKPLAHQISPLFQRQAEHDEEEGKIQMNPLPSPAFVQCQPIDEEEDENLRRRPIEEEEEKLQAKERSGKTREVTSQIQSQIESIRNRGEPLPQPVRRYFESRFGHDFSQIHIHAGRQAAVLAGAVNARAFAVGPNIVFGPGQYSPSSVAGRHLIAHELTHTVQQSSEHGFRSRAQVIRRVPGSVQRVIVSERTNTITFVTEDSEQSYDLLEGPHIGSAVYRATVSVDANEIHFDVLGGLAINFEFKFDVREDQLNPATLFGEGDDRQTEVELVAESQAEGETRFSVAVLTADDLEARTGLDVARLEEGVLLWLQKPEGQVPEESPGADVSGVIGEQLKNLKETPNKRIYALIKKGGLVFRIYDLYASAERISRAVDEGPRVTAQVLGEEVLGFGGGALGAAIGGAIGGAIACSPSGPGAVVCAIGGFLGGVVFGYIAGELAEGIGGALALEIYDAFDRSSLVAESEREESLKPSAASSRSRKPSNRSSQNRERGTVERDQEPRETMDSNARPGNQRPLAHDDVYEVDVLTPARIHLRGEDTDGDDLRFEIAEPPEKGELTGSGQDFSYLPDFFLHEPDDFTFVVFDGSSWSEPGVIIIRNTEGASPRRQTAQERRKRRLERRRLRRRARKSERRRRREVRRGTARTEIATLELHTWSDSRHPALLLVRDLMGADVGHTWIELKYDNPDETGLELGKGTSAENTRSWIRDTGSVQFGFWPLVTRSVVPRGGSAADIEEDISEARERVAEGDTPGAGFTGTRASGYSTNPFKSWVSGRVEEPDNEHEGDTPQLVKGWRLTPDQVTDLMKYVNVNRNSNYSLLLFNCTTFAQEAVAASGHRPPTGRGFWFGVKLPAALYRQLTRRKQRGDRGVRVV